MGRCWSPCRCPRTTPAYLRDIERSQKQYGDLRLQRRRLRRTYLGYLLFLTVGVLFASTWLALYLSRMVTRPLVALVEATHEISRGRLDYRVDVQAGSEIGQLVQSFNRMAGELEASRNSVEASGRELANINSQAGAAHPPHRNHSGKRSLGRVVAGCLRPDRPLQCCPPASASAGERSAGCFAQPARYLPRRNRGRSGPHAAEVRAHAQRDQPDGDCHRTRESERRGHRGVAQPGRGIARRTATIAPVT